MKSKMKQKIEQLFSDIFFDLDLTDEQAKMLHKHKQELLKEAEKQALNIPVISQRSELLPVFLRINSDGKIVICFRGGSDVSEEWGNYIKKLGNCAQR